MTASTQTKAEYPFGVLSFFILKNGPVPGLSKVDTGCPGYITLRNGV